jgi:hypothetical protein
MQTITSKITLLLSILFLTCMTSMAQNTKESNTKKTIEMKTYMIEREIPGAGDLTQEQLKGISQASCTVLKEMGPKIQWLHSYVSGNKIVCIYKAENEALIKEHAKKGGFPANNITEIVTTISPATAQ